MYKPSVPSQLEDNRCKCDIQFQFVKKVEDDIQIARKSGIINVDLAVLFLIFGF